MVSFDERAISHFCFFLGCLILFAAATYNFYIADFYVRMPIVPSFPKMINISSSNSEFKSIDKLYDTSYTDIVEQYVLNKLNTLSNTEYDIHQLSALHISKHTNINFVSIFETSPSMKTEDDVQDTIEWSRNILKPIISSIFMMAGSDEELNAEAGGMVKLTCSSQDIYLPSSSGYSYEYPSVAQEDIKVQNDMETYTSSTAEVSSTLSTNSIFHPSGYKSPLLKKSSFKIYTYNGKEHAFENSRHSRDKIRDNIYVIPRYESLEKDIRQVIQDRIPNAGTLYANNGQHHFYDDINHQNSLCVMEGDCNQLDIVLYFPCSSTPVHIIGGHDSLDGLDDVENMPILEMRSANKRLDGMFMIVNKEYIEATTDLSAKIQAKIRSVLYPQTLISPLSKPNLNPNSASDTSSDNITPLLSRKDWLAIQYVYILTKYHAIIQQFHVVHELIHGIAEIKYHLRAFDSDKYSQVIELLNNLYESMSEKVSVTNGKHTDISLVYALDTMESHLRYLLHAAGDTPGKPGSHPDSEYGPLSPLSRNLIFNYEHKLAILLPFWVPIIYPLFIGLYSVLKKKQTTQL